MHPPEPAVLRSERHRVAAAVPLHGEDRTNRRAGGGTLEQRGGPRLEAGEPVDRGERREGVPPKVVGSGVGTEHQRGRQRAGRRWLNLDLGGHLSRVGHPVGEGHRQHVGQSGALEGAFAERRPAAQRKQPAAPLADELADHPELVGSEEPGLHAAENQPAITEQIGPAGREAANQIETVIDPEPEELALRGSLEAHQLDVAVTGRGPPQEREFGPDLALEVEDLFAPAANPDPGAQRVVLAHRLAGERPDRHGEPAGAFLERRDPDRHRDDIGAARHRHVGGRHDLAAVFHLKGQGFTTDPSSPERHRPQQHRPLEGGARQLHSFDRHVPLETFPPDPDGIDRHLGRLEAEQHLGQRIPAVVGAVGGHHNTGERGRPEHPARLIERAGQIGANAGAG